MTAAYFNGPSQFERTRTFYERHIPVKRVAPCPPSEHIIAQAKRSRTVATPSRPPKEHALTIRNSNLNVESDASNKAIFWNSTRCFQVQPNVFPPATPIRGLQCGQFNNGNARRMSMPHKMSGYNEQTNDKKSSCCPLLIWSSGFSTPPYRMGSTQCAKGELEEKRSRKKPKRSKRRSTESKDGARNCFDAMTTSVLLGQTGSRFGAVTNVVGKEKRSRSAAPQRAAPQHRMDALSVYHSFLKQREVGMKNDDKSGLSSGTATFVGSNPMSRVGCSTKDETNSKYSSNFIPQMTSTPQKQCASTSKVHIAKSPAFKVPLAPAPRAVDKESVLDEVLKVLDDERKMGSSHIQLPLEELTDIVNDMKRQKKDDEEGTNSASSGSTGTTATNNNNDDLDTKEKPVSSRPNLPGIYPIGAPRAASSPIPIPKKRERVISDDVMLIGEDCWKFYPIGSDESGFSTGLAAGAVDIWRPW